MRLAVSLALHVAVLAALLAFVRRSDRPASAAAAAIDVTIVRPPARVESAPEPTLAATPARPHQVARAAPRAATPAAAAAAAAAPAAASGDGTGTGSGTGSGSGSGSGTGTGSGSGDGDSGGSGGGGGAARDLSTKPIALGFHHAQLPYTRAALEARVEGDVMISVLVGIDGKVHDTRLARGLGYGLDAIALSLVPQLAFRPAHDVLGHDTTAWITWRFHFAPPHQGATP